MNLNTIAKSIKLLLHKKLNFATINGENFFVLTMLDSRIVYIKIPQFVISYEFLELENKLVVEALPQNNVNLNDFTEFLSNLGKDKSKVFRKKLLLKGLGYKATFDENKSLLDLRLGFSHPIILNVPRKTLNVKINKQNLTLESNDLRFVGNFAKKIRQLKLPDVYKGKGVWYKNEIRVLKELKKK
jgi:ribosomal protein L6P/L9E